MAIGAKSHCGRSLQNNALKDAAIFPAVERNFLDSTFVLVGQQEPEKGQTSLEIHVSGSANTSNESTAILPPSYEAVDHSACLQSSAWQPSLLCPPSCPPPSYEEATRLSPRLDGQKRMTLRNSKTYNSSPSKVELKNHVRKLTSSVERYKRKIRDREDMKSIVGKRQRQLYFELNHAKAAVKKAKATARKRVEKLENKQARQIQQLQASISKRVSKVEEDKKSWEKLALDMLECNSNKTSVSPYHLKKMKKLNYNLKRKLNRRDEAMPKLEERLKLAQAKVKEAESSLDDQKLATAAMEGIVAELESQLAQKEDRIQSLEKLCNSLKTLESKKNGVYSTEIRLTYYHLLQLGVSANKVEEVVRSVLGNLSPFDMKTTPLPKRSLAQRMKLEAGCLAQVRGIVEWSKREDKSVGYHSDKSPKSQLEWLTHKFVLSPTPEERDTGKRTTFTLSLSPVTGGSAQDSLDDLIANITQIREMAREYGIADCENIYSIRHIAAKMSDRAATEVKHTKLLTQAKVEELKQTPDWSDKPAAEQQKLSEVMGLTCSMHKLHNVAEAMTKASTIYLQGESQSTFGRKPMVGAKKHVYETDKLLCTESKKEIAEGKDFKAYCLATEVVDVAGCELFKPIVGSRYFIFLLNAIPTYCGQEFIKTFLLDQRDLKGGWNKLEQSVYDGYACEKTMAEERAYSILYHEVFLPLYRKCKAAKNPLALNSVYESTVQKLKEWGDNPEILFRGEGDLYPSLRDPKYTRYIAKVREPVANDDIVIKVLGVACQAGYDKLQSHASEHLPGGQYSNPTEQMVSTAALLDGTNDTCESDFGVLDRQCHTAPNSNPLSLSSMVRAKRDHAAQWAAEQTKEEQEKAINFARRSASKLRISKDTQLLNQYVAREPVRRGRIEKRRLNRAKKEAAVSSRLQALKDGRLILNERNIKNLGTAAVNNQIQFWVLISGQLNLRRGDLLKGRSKLSLAQKRKMLKTLISENSTACDNLLASIRRRDGGESSSDSSASSDDNMPLSHLRRNEPESSDDDDTPLAQLRRPERQESSDDDDTPLAQLRRPERQESSDDDDTPLAQLSL
ncbi:hypothetical protein Bbelb_361770 [Branchiostoma belcheri]|nr:hypothetical protein Bbelb_361770 [Branchiostoma belcheri]